MYDFTITIKGKIEASRLAHELAREIQRSIDTSNINAKVGLKVEDKPPIEETEEEA